MSIEQIVTLILIMLVIAAIAGMGIGFRNKELASDPMTPYCVAKGKKWFRYNYARKLLTHAEDGRTFRKLAMKADSWLTCPIGNLPQCITRNSEGEPEDYTLLTQGNQFSVLAMSLKNLQGSELAYTQEKMIALLRTIELRGNEVVRREIAKYHESEIRRINESVLVKK